MSTYRGAVEPGAPPQVRDLGVARVAKMAVGPLAANVYLITCTATGTGLLVDAADDPRRILDLVGDEPLAGIVTTHRHPDHWQALSAVAAATGAPTIAHPEDADGLPVDPDVLVVDGELVTVGALHLKVVHLAGHTPGSIALHLPGAGGHLFSGDSLFPGGPGNTFGDPVAFTRLMDELEAKVFGVMPDPTWVYPGHGRDTTLGDERPHLGEWRARGW